ncbi:MAG: sortase [Clostridia bacterium]|nr:sortase [Clostridia bacterium]
MKSKAGIVCIVLGVLLMSGALLIAMYNTHQDIAARDASASIMTHLVHQIRENTANDPAASVDEDILGELQIPTDLLTDEDKRMTEIEIDGHAYIGYLSIPTLDLELPIMSSWSYPKLKLAPCRYSGSVRGEDLVLMAHNFYYHFGRISQLNVGDTLSFTDMDGVTTRYKVAAMDILESTAVDVMTAGEFDLTLFTCTYSGQSRVTVYCDKES